MAVIININKEIIFITVTKRYDSNKETIKRENTCIREISIAIQARSERAFKTAGR